jgi:hypothetical protein
MQEIQVRSSRDDKVERGGTPWHEWRWMDRFEKANLDKTDSQPSLRDRARYTLLLIGFQLGIFESVDRKKLSWARLAPNSFCVIGQQAEDGVGKAIETYHFRTRPVPSGPVQFLLGPTGFGGLNCTVRSK